MIENNLTNDYGSLASYLKKINFDLAQNLLRSSSPPSLKRISLIRVAINQWQREDIRNEILFSFILHKPCLNCYQEHLPPFVKKVFEKLSNILLPKSLHEPLREMVKLTGMQIFKYFAVQDQLNFFISSQVKIYWNSICWTSQGTINSLKTALFLLENDNLKMREKYILACNNCIEEVIRFILRRHLSTIYNHFVEETHIRENENYRLVLFWTLRIKGEEERFSEIVGKEFNPETTINKYIFEWAISHDKDVAVEYLWQTYTSELSENLEDFTSVAAIWSDSTTKSISFYLFSQLNEAQIEEMFEKDSSLFLRMFLGDGRWRNLLPVAKYVQQYITSMDFWNALEIVKLCLNYLLYNQYTNILEIFFAHFDNKVNTDFQSVCKMLFHSLLSKDIRSLQLLLSKGSQQDKNCIIYSNLGMNRCTILILQGRLKTLDLFIRKMLATREEINSFKKHFFEKKRSDICSFLISRGKFELLDQFLIMFCLEVKVHILKQVAPLGKYEEIVDSSLENVSCNDPKQLVVTDKFLNWCFRGSEELIAPYKIVVFSLDENNYTDDKDIFLREINNFVATEEWRLVEQYLRWALFTKDNTSNCKKKLKCIETLGNIMMTDSSHGKDNFESFKKLAASFLTEDEITELKGRAKSSETLRTLVQKLLQERKLIEVDDLLEWWFSSASDKIKKFREMCVPDDDSKDEHIHKKQKV